MKKILRQAFNEDLSVGRRAVWIIRGVRALPCEHTDANLLTLLMLCEAFTGIRPDIEGGDTAMRLAEELGMDLYGQYGGMTRLETYLED